MSLTLRWNRPARRLVTTWGGQTTPSYLPVPDVDTPTPIAIVVGPRGNTGPPGTGSAPLIFDQPSLASPWIVNHNLARSPGGVRVLSVGGIEIYADVIETSPNQVQIFFAQPTAGKALIL